MNSTQCKMARAGLGWSAKDLAAKAGLGYATVARFEAGSQVDPESLGKMEAALIDAGAEFSIRRGKDGVAVPSVSVAGKPATP